MLQKSLFTAFSTNTTWKKNGKLDKAELKELLEGDLGLSPEQSCIYMLILDHAGDYYYYYYYY